jgi:hypothetical protein
MLSDRGLNDRVLYHDVPVRVHERMQIPRQQLDGRLDGTITELWDTWRKDTLHKAGASLKKLV